MCVRACVCVLTDDSGGGEGCFLHGQVAGGDTLYFMEQKLTLDLPVFFTPNI